MKYLIIPLVFLISGCSTIDTIKEYWPKPHDPVMFNNLVRVDIAIDNVDCDKPEWTTAQAESQQLARYTEWRKDPQRENIKGLAAHTERMSKGGSKTFCELGKKTAKQRIQAAKSAWEGR
jgi:hypothetical protein